MPNRAEILKQKFSQSLGLPFRKLLPESEIEQVLVEEKVQYRNCVFTPAVTLWAFLSQVLEPDKSREQCCQSCDYLVNCGRSYSSLIRYWSL